MHKIKINPTNNKAILNKLNKTKTDSFQNH